VYARFTWHESLEKAGIQGLKPLKGNDLHIGRCAHCKDRVVWFVNGNQSYMLWPFGVANAPLPHDDMPDEVKADYVEARSICALSPRGAAALLRLSIQKLCRVLGNSGRDLNTDIGLLVRAGLPVAIQKALDVVRVTGNNAVHPGEMNLDDNPETVTVLFGLINLIIDNRIAEPKRIDALYKTLPDGARKAIEERDR